MTEDDQLWSPTVRETQAELAARAKIILDNIFESCDVSDTCTLPFLCQVNNDALILVISHFYFGT